MRTTAFRLTAIGILLAGAVWVSASRAQDVSAPPSTVPAGSASPEQQPAVPSQSALTRSGTPCKANQEAQHRFWNRDNAWLFSAVAASRTLDYFSTLNMRRRGRQEILLSNEVVDHHAAFAAVEAGGTALSIGASYLFHRYHHHRLEHWTSLIHASLGTGGAIRNYCLRSAHPSTAP